MGEHPTSNIEHPTSKCESRRRAAEAELGCWMFDVGCWMFFLCNCPSPFLILPSLFPEVRLNDLGIFPNLDRRALGDLHPVIEHGNALANAHHHLHVM